MKNTQILIVAMVMTVLPGFAQANEKAKDLPACQSIVKSCEAAGFEPGEHKKDGKGLWIDCIHAIAKGKTVPGVTAAQADAKACQDAAKALRESK